MQFDLWNRRLGWLSLVAVVLTAGVLSQIRSASAEGTEATGAAEKTATAEATAEAIAEAASPPVKTATPKAVEIERAMKEAHETHTKVAKELQKQQEQIHQQLLVQNEQHMQENKQRIAEQQALTKKHMDEMRTVTKRLVSSGAETGRYWLGIECREASPELRAQLGLDDGQGLVILRVAPESPAAINGLRQHDVLVVANDVKLGRVADLSKVANAADGKQIDLQIIHAGKPQKISVVPAEREADQIQVITKPGPGMLVPNIYQYQAVTLPDNMSVNIERKGSDPAKVTVKRGQEQWEVTANDLSKLPDDVRPAIEQMLSGFGSGKVNFIQTAPGALQLNNGTLTLPGGGTLSLTAPNFQYKRMPQAPAAPGISAAVPIAPGAPTPIKSPIVLNADKTQAKQVGQLTPDIMKRLDQVTRELEKTQQDLKLLREALPSSMPRAVSEKPNGANE